MDIIQQAHLFVASGPANAADPLILDMVSEIERLRTALKRAIPYVENADSPGGCDGSADGCDHCEVIREMRGALGLNWDGKPLNDEQSGGTNNG